MKKNNKILFRKINLTVLIILISLVQNLPYLNGLNLFQNQAHAAQSTISTRADFDEGAFTRAESYTKEGEVKLEADGTWNARVWRTNDVQPNNGTAIETDGTYTYMLATRENTFQRYVPDEDEWEDLSGAPASAYIGSALTYLDGYIYAEFGGYQNEFARYNISTRTWELLEDAPELIYAGGSLSNDGTYIYALRGGATADFWRYNPSTDSWSSMSSTPAAINTGASLV